MTKRSAVLVLSSFALILLIASSLAAIVLDDGGTPQFAQNMRGDTVEVYGGIGLYQFDTVYKAVLFRGFDWANLIVSIPLLILGMYLFKRGRSTGNLLISSVFAYLAYNYLIGVMGNAFNNLFLVWTALFSTGLFGLALILQEIDIPSFSTKLGEHFPRRSLSIYMFILAVFLLAQYLGEILPAYLSGKPPASLGVYTTLELAALELGIMIPLHILGGILLWKKDANGYLLSVILLFTALITFISLSISSLLFFFQYGRGSLTDMIVPVILVIITLSFSIAVTRNVKE